MIYEIDWEELDNRMKGLQTDQAAKLIFAEVIKTVNALVRAHNEK